MLLVKYIKKLPIDFGQKEMRHRTFGKIIALKLAGCGSGLVGLDAGCADGYWTEKLKKLGWKMKAVDKQTDYPGAKHFDLDRGIPFSDNCFDLVWSSEVIAYLQNTEFFVREIKRVLRPGGKFIITTPNNNFWLNYVLKTAGRSLRDLQDPKQKFFFTWEDIKNKFSQDKIYGFFPYLFLKLKINRLVGLLSPTFIIFGEKRDE